MMKMYSVRDQKAEMYHMPFFALTNGVAIRIFADLANDPNTFVGKHPNDYSLFYLGEFDDQRAHFEIAQAPVHIGVAAEYLSAQPTVFTPENLETLQAMNGEDNAAR